MTGRYMSATEVEEVGQAVVSNQELTRKLVTLGFDTLEIMNPEGKKVNGITTNTIIMKALYITLACGIIAAGSFYFIHRKKKKDKDNVDMSNVINSMFNCTSIYDRLKVKCHPDKFLDETMKEKAEKLFQELQKNRHNYNKLLELEQIINNELRNK